jgi:hypothetical protein
MTTSRADHIQRLHDLSLCLNNEDSLGWEVEARNLEADRPAYWYRGQTSPASWLVEMSRCEEHNRSLLKAAEAFADRHTSHDMVDVYDAVIPLNEAAVRELGLCYRLQSTFRDDAELRDRERKAIFDPVFFPGMADEMRGRWQSQYEACQQRWADRRDAEYEARKAFEDTMSGAEPQWPVSRGLSTTASLAIAATNLDPMLMGAVASALDIPADPARAAVEGEAA